MKIGLISLGCPKNLVDSEVMLGLARDAGHELTRNPEDADVLVVNTCAFIDSAKQESIDAILEMAQHKVNGNCQRLVVTGCLGERYREELRTEIPEIDAVLGTGEVPEIVRAIGGGAPPGPPRRGAGVDDRAVRPGGEAARGRERGRRRASPGERTRSRCPPRATGGAPPGPPPDYPPRRPASLRTTRSRAALSNRWARSPSARAAATWPGVSSTNRAAAAGTAAAARAAA